jgi:hypothetical protein
VRNHQFEVGAPLHFDPQYAHIAALEYALGALSADVVASLRAAADRRRLQVNEVEAVVSGELNNPLTFLGVIGETGHAGLERVSVTTYVSSPASDAELAAAWEEALARSPLVHTFRAACSLELSLKAVPS